MIKDFLLARAAPGLSCETLQHYLQFTHAPLALANPALAREVERYTMNHASEDTTYPFQLYPSIPGLALVVEHMFGGWEGIARFSADEHYLATVRPDEEHMVRTLMDGAPQFVAVDEEHALFTAPTCGRLRMFDFVRRHPTMTREHFLEQLDTEGAWAATDPAYRAAVARRVHSIVGAGVAAFGGDAEPFDAVIEVWIADADRLAALTDVQRERRSAFCDPDRSFTAVTDEQWICGENDAFGPRAAAAQAMAMAR